MTQTAMAGQHQRLRRALRILEDRKHLPGRPYNRARLNGSPIDRHRTRLDLAAAVIREERRQHGRDAR